MDPETGALTRIPGGSSGSQTFAPRRTVTYRQERNHVEIRHHRRRLCCRSCPLFRIGRSALRLPQVVLRFGANNVLHAGTDMLCSGAIVLRSDGSCEQRASGSACGPGRNFACSCSVRECGDVRPFRRAERPAELPELFV